MNQFKHANWWRSYLGELSKDFGQLQAWISSGNTSTSKEKQRGKASKVKRSKEDSSCSLLSHFWSTSQSPFFTYYISFQILGSQEFIGSNGARFGVKTKKLWPFEDSFCYCWTRFWSTFWSSNYAYHISFWSLGSQESSASNGVRFGFETKKLWPFERIQNCKKAGE